jgi:hypothetical protein
MKSKRENWNVQQLLPELKTRLYHSAAVLVEKIRTFSSRLIFIERNEL